MKIQSTPFKDLYVLEPIIYKDERGYFMESYNSRKLEDAGITTTFIQDNQSFSNHGVIRGLHFQTEPRAQAKLVRVLAGAILDVVVDLRKDQKTYKQVHVLELSKDNHKQLFIPKGFAHGFSVLSESAVVMYKCDDVYAPGFEGGVRYNDPDLKIDWKIPPGKQVVSGKDLSLPLLKDLEFSFVTSPS